MHVIATLAAPTAQRVVEQLVHLPTATTAVEVRLDALWQEVPDAERATEDLLVITEAARLPLIATLRPVREGGGFEGPEEVRLGLLAAAGRSGFAWLDVEADAAAVPGVLGYLASSGAAVFASRHMLGAAPCRDDGLRVLTGAQDAGGPIDKFAFTSSAFPDTLRALELAHAHAQRGGRPAVAPLGHGGAALRALLPLAGNTAAYGHAGDGEAMPGQPALADIVATWRHWGLDPGELPVVPGVPWLAVVGTPVAHSLSPRMHNAALRRAARPERFGSLEVPGSAGALRLLAHVAPRLGLAGVSVTAPLKLHATQVARPDAVAQAVGAANCIRFGGGEAASTNTDATALARLVGQAAHGATRGVVLGAGGAARAATWALRSLGMQATLCSRDEARGAAVARQLGAQWLPWREADKLEAQVWVNAAGAFDQSPLRPAQLAGATVVELCYLPDGTVTALEGAAREGGAHCIDGRNVLLEQGVDAFRHWFGGAPDRDAMRAALGAPAPSPLLAR